MITDALYKEIIEYVKLRLYSIMFNYSKDDYLDITHSVIADSKFTPAEWKHLVDRYIYRYKDDKRNIKAFFSGDDIISEEEHIERWFCKGCQEWMPKDNFKNSHTLCGKCYYAKNKERIRANHQRWKAKNKEQASFFNKVYYYQNRKERMLQNREWKINNEDKIREYSREYYFKNKEKINAYNKKYRKENKEKIDKRRKEYIQEKRKSERKFNNP